MVPRSRSNQLARRSRRCRPEPLYTLTLADGRMSAHADCNLCSTTFTLSGQTLNVAEVMACTRAACPTMAFESAYTSILALRDR